MTFGIRIAINDVKSHECDIHSLKNCQTSAKKQTGHSHNIAGLAQCSNGDTISCSTSTSNEAKPDRYGVFTTAAVLKYFTLLPSDTTNMPHRCTYILMPSTFPASLFHTSPL